MRNLRCTGRRPYNFANEALPLTATAWDAATDDLLCAFGPSQTLAVIELKRFTTSQEGNAGSLIASWDAPCPNPEINCDKILNLHYFPDTATACLILAGGDIVIVREQPQPGEDLIEIVGSVDAGISAASWSPDEELLVITTGADTLLYMSRSFEAITTIELTSDDLKASNHVSVGWGKKETQFQGKRAKAMRDPTVPEHVDEGVLSKHDNREVTISWRGDGQYVAVNAILEGKRRIIRVYSREGTLDSVSEPVDGLEGALSWRPAGNLIAGLKRCETYAEVVFFERNGLRHGQFPLRQDAEKLDDIGKSISLSWNSDSTALAVGFEDRVQLWTMGNYHYYLKKEILSTSRVHDRAPTGVSWHPEKPLKLAITSDVSLQRNDYEFAVTGGSRRPPSDIGLVGVIDGTRVRTTPLRLTNMPPPMALKDFDAGKSIVDFAFREDNSRIAYLTSDRVIINETDLFMEITRNPVMPGSTRLFSPRAEIIPRQVAFGGQDQVYVLCDEKESMSSTVFQCSYEVKNMGDPIASLELNSVINLMTDIHGRSVFVQLADSQSSGNIQRVHSDGSALRLEPVARVHQAVLHTEIAEIMDTYIAFGITASGSLFANERLLVRNCTSFLLTPAHLIFTTSQHLLKFVHLSAVDDLEIPLDEPEKDERCRSIERGAKLITASPSAYSVVLQMPRGNMETIYPRALVLAGIRRSVEEKDYKKAFLACRSHRVDMNILHDHMPEQFIEDVDLFVKQVKKVEHIDLFLSQLRDEDVSQTMYRETTKKTHNVLANGHSNGVKSAVNGTINPPTSSTTDFKVNRICFAFLDVLKARTSTNLQNIITANVCMSPPAIDAALFIIAGLRRESEDLAEKAAEHICFLVDVNQVYDHALGSYDLDLALLIVQQSQKDPREYLPYLQSLEELPSLQRKFTIDNDLKRYAKAVGHLHERDAFDELKSYVKKHELYTQAFELYEYQPSRLYDLKRLHADYLLSRNKYKEAGKVFASVLDHQAAVEAFRSANLWHEALTCATIIPLPKEELTALATDLADALTETKDYYDAAIIHRDYLSNIESAAQSFCKASHYAEATRLVALHSRLDLLTSVIDPALVEASGSMTELLADMRSQLDAQVPRLKELRVKKAEDPLAFYGGDPTAAGQGADIPDNISLAPTDASTSGGTFMTRYTGAPGTGTIATGVSRKTSKNRRREERKRARGKKGSVYEEEYLVSSIGRLIERVNSTNEECQRLVDGLEWRQMPERAKAVRRAMVDIVGRCKGCVGEVWQVAEGKKEGEGEEADGDDGGARPVGADGVLWDSMMAGARKTEPPTVKDFEG